MAKSKKSKSSALYSKGKKLTKFKEEFVKRVAASTNKDVSTPAKLKKFYESKKELFENHFESGLTSIPKSSTQVFTAIDKADQYGKKFFIERDGKKKEVSANELKYELSKIELQLNSMFESTGAEFSYKLDFENNITMSLPDIIDEDEYTDESLEVITDHFSEDYGINLYISEPKNKHERERHEQYKEEYTNKIKSRIKQYKPRKKSAKSAGKKTGKGRNRNKKN